MNHIHLSIRDRIQKIFCQKMLVLSAELILFAAIRAFEFIHIPTDFVLLPFGWISLWLRKHRWRDVGLQQPARWPRVLGLGAMIGIGYQLVEYFLFDPLLVHFTEEPLDFSQFDSMQGNIPNLIAYIIIGWLLGGLLEELIYRGYLMNRIADLAGNNHSGWIISSAVSSILFAIGHINLGITSVLENFVFALVFSGLYLFAKRNLWLPIIAHGFYNTVGFIFIYLSL